MCATFCFPLFYFERPEAAQNIRAVGATVLSPRRSEQSEQALGIEAAGSTALARILRRSMRNP